ncbi:MAG: hypothetical protein WD845_02885 [Pirellulales bacterium]
MPIDRRTLEAIEACRPGSDDLLSTELADVALLVDGDPAVHAVYARAQRWDTAVSRAMQEVPVPPGLAERLLSRLAAGDAVAMAVAASDATIDEATASALPRQLPWSKARWSRRGWLGMVAATAATVAVAVGLTQYLRSGADAPVETLADAWLAQLDTSWSNMADAPKRFLVPASITAEATGWQRIDPVGSVGGVAYRLQSAHAGTARLFVVRLAKKGLPSSPPVQPQWTTGGRSIGYWQSGDLVFVLVVDGNADRYREFANVSRMPLA